MKRRDFDATRQQQLLERFLCDSARYLGLTDGLGGQRLRGKSIEKLPPPFICGDPKGSLCRCSVAAAA
ncbi:hypothetical protein Thimo_1611 [Thioflavicoccus mobilis 8321]|uniref:Uncharacterized protein n=1 Tax=Thioflavicoccus mobilis 8321 TaxID=765912 RepID=L0GYD1_9GAMM|nr:hypothetical protein [Thioflavicoccus mobilis]AGA90390.1 hypothetical protein Thimo_1611 [Thioflavicoccus mobilis 8321]